MCKYGDTAKMAVGFVQQKTTATPMAGWEKAVNMIFPDSKSSRIKGCPKNAFLGLCEAGKIKNISQGSYTKSQKNKDYALSALSLLQNNPDLKSDPNLLWKKVQNGVNKQHNQQMDVVISLFESGLTE